MSIYIDNCILFYHFCVVASECSNAMETRFPSVLLMSNLLCYFRFDDNSVKTQIPVKFKTHFRSNIIIKSIFFYSLPVKNFLFIFYFFFFYFFPKSSGLFKSSPSLAINTLSVFLLPSNMGLIFDRYIIHISFKTPVMGITWQPIDLIITQTTTNYSS